MRFMSVTDDLVSAGVQASKDTSGSQPELGSPIDTYGMTSSSDDKPRNLPAVPLASPIGFLGVRFLDTELRMAADRRILLNQTDALLAQMGAFVRDHLVLLSNHQAQALGRLQLTVMQTCMAGQHGRVPHDESRRLIEAYTDQFEQQFAQLYTHHVPRIAPWPTLPAGSATLACLRLKANLLQTLQTMTLAEARVHDTQGPAASTQWCASLLSPRLTLVSVYDATRLLFAHAASTEADEATFTHARLVPLAKAMRRVDTDLEHLLVQRGLKLPYRSTGAATPSSSALVPLDKQLTRCADLFLLLAEATQHHVDPMDIWAMSLQSIQRLLYVCQLAYQTGEHAAELPQTVSDITTQMQQLLAFFDAPDLALPRAAPSA